MDRPIIALCALALSTVSALADGPDIVADMASKAIEKGYGATCSLEMKPAAAGGYYPCLDFGPYRFVKGYGKVYGLVVQKGKEPFLVMSGTVESPAWIYDGPWQADMPARIVMFWNDTVEGMATKRVTEEAAIAEKRAAEDYIRKLRGDDAPQKDPPADEQPSGTAASPAPPRTEPMAPDAKAILSSK